MIQVTAMRGGLVGRSYRQAPWPLFSKEFELTMTEIVRMTSTLAADSVAYVLELAGNIRS